MSKHTPGPWFASHDSAEDCPDHKNSGLAMIDTGRDMDWPIARLMEWNNVPLVLAAPELLAAGKAVASAIRNLEGQEIQYSLAKDLSSALAELNAAIAKAEGAQ